MSTRIYGIEVGVLDPQSERLSQLFCSHLREIKKNLEVRVYIFTIEIPF